MSVNLAHILILSPVSRYGVECFTSLRVFNYDIWPTFRSGRVCPVCTTSTRIRMVKCSVKIIEKSGTSALRTTALAFSPPPKTSLIALTHAPADVR